MVTVHCIVKEIKLGKIIINEGTSACIHLKILEANFERYMYVAKLVWRMQECFFLALLQSKHLM